jgi:hypothetical protein
MAWSGGLEAYLSTTRGENKHLCALGNGSAGLCHAIGMSRFA